ncbi:MULTISPECIES: histidine phosphatase family protein [unclassified Sedimentibacter]|uniref:histidine phosphatase family protein n=1 Tax=unclassified Sedimentibacter TaxID=2649220 RepID=UPI0027DED065|nr:histidine phosphatase family protein [Sedimentibacter sp. MB35-C1]WMJ76304.1 histidine phosphatase family protein [Sedimentibacter sp. MB35-C1]
MIYLVRHGESEANINKKFCGITDVKLSLRGKEQAALAGRRLKHENISNIYASPLIRASITAKIIGSEIGFEESKIKTERCLAEVNFGLFENMTWEEITASYVKEAEDWMAVQHKFKFPQGESYTDIIARISEFIDNVPDNSLIVTHFGVIQAVLLYLGIADDTNLWDFIISNCDILVLNNRKFVRIVKCS